MFEHLFPVYSIDDTVEDTTGGRNSVDVTQSGKKDCCSVTPQERKSNRSVLREKGGGCPSSNVVLVKLPTKGQREEIRLGQLQLFLVLNDQRAPILKMFLFCLI